MSYVCTLVVYITGNRDLPDIYAHALGPWAYMYVYQANPPAHVIITYTYIHTHTQYNIYHIYIYKIKNLKRK